jgi:hypothetical protein
MSREVENIPNNVGQFDSILTSFQYMATSRVHDKAHVNITLNDLWPKEYCLCFYGDCVIVGHPYTCMIASGYGFAYTEDGLLKETFLQQSISDTKKEWRYYCG